MRVYWDTETAPTRHDRADCPATVCQIAVDEGPVVIVDPKLGADSIRQHARNGATMVGHATVFDIQSLGLTPADFPQGWYDTQTRGVIKGAAEGLHEKASAGLKAQAGRLGYAMIGKEGGDDRLQLSFGNATPDNLTPEQRQYAIQDVEATRLVFKAQGGERRFPDEERQNRCSWDVWRMARRGVRLDVDRVHNLLHIAYHEVATRRQPLVDAGIIQPRGPKKDPWREEAVDRATVQELLAGHGVTAKPKRRAQDTRPESGLLCGDDEVLRGTGDARLIALADYRAAQKWLSLVEAFDVGPVARAFWKPMVSSGRISASKPNLTQVPKGPLRQCVIPSPGNKLVCADFKGLEFWAWADICERWLGWSEAAEALRAGLDPHTELARHLDGDRQAAKAGNYGLLGGMGIPRLARQYGLTEERAAEVDRAWRQRWPESRSYFRKVRAGALGDGRYRTVLPWSGRERVAFYSEAANFLIQGTGSDIAKEALARATRAGLPVVMLVHDELVLDVPEAEARDAARELERCMEEAGREVCPSVPWPQRAEIRDTWA